MIPLISRAAAGRYRKCSQQAGFIYFPPFLTVSYFERQGFEGLSAISLTVRLVFLLQHRNTPSFINSAVPTFSSVALFYGSHVTTFFFFFPPCACSPQPPAVSRDDFTLMRLWSSPELLGEHFSHDTHMRLMTGFISRAIIYSQRSRHNIKESCDHFGQFLIFGLIGRDKQET